MQLNCLRLILVRILSGTHPKRLSKTCGTWVHPKINVLTNLPWWVRKRLSTRPAAGVVPSSVPVQSWMTFFGCFQPFLFELTWKRTWTFFLGRSQPVRMSIEFLSASKGVRGFDAAWAVISVAHGKQWRETSDETWKTSTLFTLSFQPTNFHKIPLVFPKKKRSKNRFTCSISKKRMLNMYRKPAETKSSLPWCNPSYLDG